MPITWQNIAAPSFRGANKLLKSSSDEITSSLEGLGDSASELAQVAQDSNTNPLLDRIKSTGSLDELKQLAASKEYAPETLNNQYIDSDAILTAVNARKDKLVEDKARNLEIKAFESEEDFNAKNRPNILNKNKAEAGLSTKELTSFDANNKNAQDLIKSQIEGNEAGALESLARINSARAGDKYNTAKTKQAELETEEFVAQIDRDNIARQQNIIQTQFENEVAKLDPTDIDGRAKLVVDAMNNPNTKNLAYLKPHIKFLENAYGEDFDNTGDNLIKFNNDIALKELQLSETPKVEPPKIFYKGDNIKDLVDNASVNVKLANNLIGWSISRSDLIKDLTNFKEKNNLPIGVINYLLGTVTGLDSRWSGSTSLENRKKEVLEYYDKFVQSSNERSKIKKDIDNKKRNYNNKKRKHVVNNLGFDLFEKIN